MGDRKQRFPHFTFFHFLPDNLFKTRGRGWKVVMEGKFPTEIMRKKVGKCFWKWYLPKFNDVSLVYFSCRAKGRKERRKSVDFDRDIWKSQFASMSSFSFSPSISFVVREWWLSISIAPRLPTLAPYNKITLNQATLFFVQNGDLWCPCPITLLAPEHRSLHHRTCLFSPPFSLSFFLSSSFNMCSISAYLPSFLCCFNGWM